jgi:hypothetical protein
MRLDAAAAAVAVAHLGQRLRQERGPARRTPSPQATSPATPFSPRWTDYRRLPGSGETLPRALHARRRPRSPADSRAAGRPPRPECGRRRGQRRGNAHGDGAGRTGAGPIRRARVSGGTSNIGLPSAPVSADRGWSWSGRSRIWPCQCPGALPGLSVPLPRSRERMGGCGSRRWHLVGRAAAALVSARREARSSALPAPAAAARGCNPAIYLLVGPQAGGSVAEGLLGEPDKGGWE